MVYNLDGKSVQLYAERVFNLTRHIQLSTFCQMCRFDPNVILLLSRKSKFMEGIVAEISCDLLLRSLEAAISPRMHSPPEFNNRLPTACQRLPIACWSFHRPRLIFLERTGCRAYNILVTKVRCGFPQ